MINYLCLVIPIYFQPVSSEIFSLLDTTGLQASSISVDSSIINATCFFTEGSTSRGCQILSGDSTILLMISLSRGEVVAMGTAPFIFGLLTENIVAVEILENGDQSEIRVSPAMVVSFPTTTTTQPTSKSLYIHNVHVRVLSGNFLLGNRMYIPTLHSMLHNMCIRHIISISDT